MSKFRKKPVTIEAFRMGIEPRPDWFQDKVTSNEITTHVVEGYKFNSGRPFDHTPTYCKIKTLEGVMKGDYGDYIILGIQGEIYPCKPDIFEQTYDRV